MIHLVSVVGIQTHDLFPLPLDHGSRPLSFKDFLLVPLHILRDKFKARNVENG